MSINHSENGVVFVCALFPSYIQPKKCDFFLKKDVENVIGIWLYN